MKIKNQFIASLLIDMGVKGVNASLTIDDSTGTPLTFPDISEISEIAVGTATDAPDGTYTIAVGDASITIVVIAGLVDEIVTPAGEDDVVEVDAELQAVLTAVVANYTALNAKFVALEADHNALKVSLKHDGDAAGAAAKAAKDAGIAGQFKIVG
jgi:hypothetical protein